MSDELPLLPYAGTSGWSGSDASRTRAETEDRDGTTTRRQSQVLFLLAGEGVLGATWKEVADRLGWHHGQASGALSVLHKEGKVERLVARRNRCSVYVLPQFRHGRPASPHGRRASEAQQLRQILTDLIAELRERHYPHDTNGYAPCCCKTCGGKWPCYEAEAADRAEVRMRGLDLAERSLRGESSFPEVTGGE